MNNFDLKKFLIENRLTSQTRKLNENEGYSKVHNAIETYIFSFLDDRVSINPKDPKHIKNILQYLKDENVPIDIPRNQVKLSPSAFSQIADLLGKYKMYKTEAGGVADGITRILLDPKTFLTENILK